MSAWDSILGDSAGKEYGGSTRTYTGSSSAPSFAGGIYHPTPGGSTAAPGETARPGSFTLNPLDPQGTSESAQGVGALFDGLRQALWGGNEATPEGEATRKSSLLGGIPVVGDAGRAVSDVAGALGDVAAGAINATGGLLERVGAPGGEQDRILNEHYNALPEEFRKRFEEETGLGDTGLLGTGVLGNRSHFMSVALRQYEEEKAFKDPSFTPGAFTQPGSLADSVSNLFDIFNVGATAVGRTWANMDTPGQGGMSRLETIMAVGDGEYGFNPDTGILGTGILAGDPTTGLNTMEQLVYVKVRNGDWTNDDALDFLASNGQAFGHSALSNIGGAVALDPLNIATVGAGILAKTGAKGATILARSEQAADRLADATRVLEEANSALSAMRPGQRGIKAARDAVRSAEGALTEAQKSVDDFSKFRSTGTGIAKGNVLARSAEGRASVQSGYRLAGKLYSGLEGSTIGRAAKVTRTIIDPFHAIDLKMPGSTRAVDLYSDALPRSVVDTLGVHHYKGVLDDLARIDHTGGMQQQFVDDIGVASANLGREGLMDMFRATQLDAGLGDELMTTTPDDMIDVAVSSTRQKDLSRWLRFNTLKHVAQETWTPRDLTTLSTVLNKAYPVRTIEEWGKFLEAASKEQRALLKFAGYGHLNRRLLDFVASADAGKTKLPLGRMVLMARDTFTRVSGEALLTRLTNAKSHTAKLRLIREAQEKFPQLRYIPMREGRLERSVDDFIEWLNDSMDRLPMQVTTDELKELGDDIGDVTDLLGDGYKLGFRPEDHFLWGLERDNGTGLYRAATAPWVDHVADGAIGYRPARALRTNILGHPIVDVPVARAAVKLVDHMDSAARIFKQQVSSAMVTELARKRFIAASGKTAYAERGLSEAVAEQWWEAITKYTREHQGYSGPRGFGAGDLYGAIQREGLIPNPLLNGTDILNPEDVLRLVLEAYDGDMRYIGLTQKLSSRAKKYLFDMTGSNWAGQIAEHAWPTLKFRYNPIFQLQEKIEPWVLNAQRGVSFAVGRNLSAEDEALELLLQRMTDHSLVRQSDLDQFEYSSRILFGRGIERTAATPGTRLQKMKGIARSITEVQGMKRINMLRTFKQGLGKELRAVWEEANPGVWDQMKVEADLRAGRVLSDDDFALSLVGQQQFANDIVVSRLYSSAGKAGFKADWSNAIKTGVWHTPSDLGELRGLELEHLAERMRFVINGEEVTDLKALRGAVAQNSEVLNDIEAALKVMDADPDYIRRVRHALSFSWGGFWKTAATRFGLTADESMALQDMMAGAAKLRDMTPVDFMSQVFSPSLLNGTEGILGSLDGPVSILREARAAGRRIKARDAKLMETRTQLAGKEGVSTRDDLVRQLSKAFSAHLDPSAKRTLLLEFRPELRQAVSEGKVKFDLLELDEMWDDIAESQLADRILGYMDGVQPTGAFDDIVDEARGVAAVRDGANKYMQRRGVLPLSTRRNFKEDVPFYEESARAYSAMPSTPFERTGRKPTIQQVRKSGTELKPRPDTIDERTYDAYRDFVVDTRAQWDFMTAPKDKGGLGIKVIIAKGDPYPDSAAMRADVAKGQLRVFASDSDHPVMTNEQTVMFRAVHDVFGHAAEGFEFGPRGELNAAIKHSQMYSDTGRSAMLTETHGQTSWVNFSDDVVPETGPVPLDPDSPIADYANRFTPKEEDYLLEGVGYNAYGDEDVFQLPLHGPVGEGFAELPVEVQHDILQQFATLQEQFPDFPIQHIDVLADMHEPVEFGGLGFGPGVKGVTFGGETGEPVIFLSPRWAGDEELSAQSAAFRERARTKEKFRFADDQPTGGRPRQSELGTPSHAMPGFDQTIRHEFGHAIMLNLREGFFGLNRVKPENKVINEFLDEFVNSPAAKRVSEYGTENEAELLAELFSIAFATPEQIAAAGIHPDVIEAAAGLKAALEAGGHAKPFTAGTGGKTVREVNAAKRGTIYAEQKAGLLPQNILDQFGEQYVGRGKHIETNPDVARTAQMFGKWSDAVVNNGLLRGEKGAFAGVLADAAGIPTGAAVPYNFTEAAAINLATQTMVRKWDDAFRLQYFAQERTMLERTMNHPMFGLYPASYMWGKILPELVRFIATQPFGNKTGGLLYSLSDVQGAIALRREYDPYFDANIEELGHSQAMSFLGYMLPSLPWELGASAPPWMRSIAEQGLSNAGAPVDEQEGISLMDPAVSTFERLAPLTTSLPWAGRAVDELNGATPEEVEKDLKDRDNYVQAAELEGKLADVMDELRAALSQ